MNFGSRAEQAATAFFCTVLDRGLIALPPCFTKQSLNFFIAAELIPFTPLCSSPSLPPPLSSPNPRPALPEIAGLGAVGFWLNVPTPIPNIHTVFPERTFAHT